MATTSISPFLVVNTPRMLQSCRTSILCAFEWLHCLSAMFHHIYKLPIFVVVAGVTFPLWSILMQVIKEHDYDSTRINGRRLPGMSLKAMSLKEHVSKVDRVALVSILVYIIMWKHFGEIFVLGGAGPMTVLAPFTRHDMYLSDYKMFGLLGFLFIVENLSHIYELTIISE
eukprot:CAMPEP_0183301376 /NCGR_PEP_ID=MMETSP0160_2-20130417/7520_1 /TAXON_ID=2839 ORGANISM="Odontella Sinensis, Strain Grunow 1884" /NCGR_SAMPLE_ID=MMETSP0160_2 /ASSEMBLY_ACC=CAM_ASM_000250 /LENGTH=170 /DNA_ID=CAMNT_0025463985 /DNA_START=304 /DNA_END=813 /DNA_ORIENTATION=+